MPLGNLRDPDLTALLEQLRRDRAQGRAATEVTGEWSAALRGRLDDNLAATGSVGRGEAIPSSDLDVIRVGPGPTPRLDVLLNAGIRGDANGVQPTGHALPSTVEQWRQDACTWMAHPHQNSAVVRLGLLADANHSLRTAATEDFRDSPMLADMLRDAVSTCPPRLTGLWRKNSVNLKSEVLTPVVKIARWSALASGSSELSTSYRLATTDARYLDSSIVQDLQQAFADALSLRVDLDLGVTDDQVFQRFGRITVTALPHDAAHRLRAAAATVRGSVRTLRYLLSTSAFSVDTAGKSPADKPGRDE